MSEVVHPMARGKRLVGIKDMSEELKDMMALIGAASRVPCGQFCWAGWNALQHLPQRPLRPQAWKRH